MLGAAVGGGGGLVGGVLDMVELELRQHHPRRSDAFAVDSLVIELVAAAPKIRETIAAITALAPTYPENQLVIKRRDGRPAYGSAPSMSWWRPGREIKDPATGNCCARETTPVGKIRLPQRMCARRRGR